MVDRSLGLRRGAREVDDEPRPGRTALLGVGRGVTHLGQGDPLGVQHRLVDTVVLGIVLPDIGPVGDLGEDLAPIGLGRRVEDRVEGGLDLVAPVALEELGEAPCAHEAGGALGVEVCGQRVGHPAVSGHDPQRRLVGNSLVPQLDRRDGKPLLEDARRATGHRAGAAAADVVVVAEGLDEGDDVTLVEDRHRDAEVGEVADAALGLVDVVVEEDVALVHLGQGEVTRDRVDERAVGAAGELAQFAVVDPRAEVVRVADHRAAAGPPDRRLDLHLDAREGALDDLDEDRVDRGALGREPSTVLVCRGQAGGVDRASGDVCRVAGLRIRLRLSVARVTGCSRGGHRVSSLVMTRLPKASTRTTKPGWTGIVEPNSSMMAGPLKVSSAPRRLRSMTTVST